MADNEADERPTQVTITVVLAAADNNNNNQDPVPVIGNIKAFFEGDDVDEIVLFNQAEPVWVRVGEDIPLETNVLNVPPTKTTLTITAALTNADSGNEIARGKAVFIIKPHGEKETTPIPGEHGAYVNVNVNVNVNVAY